MPATAPRSDNPTLLGNPLAAFAALCASVLVGPVEGHLASLRARGGWLQLAACVLVDLVGAGTYLLPFFGELADVAWAPVAAYFLHAQFGPAAAVLGFVEELGPGTDFVPTATLAWILENTDYAPWLRHCLRLRRRRRQEDDLHGDHVD